MLEPTVAMELKIKLLNVKPAVSRTIRVPMTIRYDQLHVLIQLIFGWQNYHMYSFQPKGQDMEYQAQTTDMDFGPVTLAKAAFVYPDVSINKILYTYDFGQNWEHEISLTKKLTFSELNNPQLPYCVTGRGSNRIEDDYDGTGLPYDRNRLNSLLSLWSRAGEQMIRIDSLGLFPNEDAK